MRKITTIIFLSIIFSFANSCFGNDAGIQLSSEEVAWLDAKHIVRVRIGNAPPFMFTDGEVRGIAIDYLTQIFNRHGIKFSYISKPEVTWPQALKFIEQHDIVDMVPTAKITEERKKKMLFTSEYISAPWVIFTRSDADFTSSIEDLKGKIVSVEEGYVIQKKLQDDYPEIKLKVVSAQLENYATIPIRDLSTGLVDAYIGNLLSTTYLIQSKGYTNVKVAAPTPFDNHNQAMAVRDDWPELISIIDKTLAAMTPEEHSAIRNRWLSVRYEYGISSTDVLKWISIILAGSTLIVGFVLIWNRQLKKEVTLRKKVEAELLKSENRLRSALDATPFPVAFADLNADKILYWSRSALSLFGHTVPTTSEWYQIAYPDLDYRQNVIERWKHFLEIAKTSKLPVNAGEYQITCKDGSVKTCELYATFITDYLIVTFSDITERKKAARESLVLKTAIDQAPVGIALADENINIYYCNPKGLGVRGGAKTNLVQIPKDAFTNWQVLMLNGKPYEVENLPLVRAITEGKTIREDFIVRHQDGIDHICDASAYPIYEDGAIIGGMVIFLDVSERKQAEESLLMSEARFARAVHGTSDGIWDWNVVTNEDYLSPRWKELLGYAEDELINEYDTFFSRIHPDDVSRVLEAKNAHLEQCIPYNIKHRLRTKSGDYKWFQVRGMAERDDQGKATIMSGSITDITEVMQAEAEKEKLEEQLRQVYKMEAVGTMAGGIAHDFNNTLAIIIGNAEMAKDDIPLGNPIRHSIDEILQASSRASDLVKQILAFSRKEKVELIPMRPQSLIKETLKLLRSTTPQTVSIVQEISQDCHSVLADPTQLHQLVMNFFANALDAMDEKGEVTVSLEEVDLGREAFDRFPVILPIGFNKSGVYAKLSVRDTGNGIDTETINRIFDPFYTTKDVGKGTGMGLSVVYGIVESHGGFITVDSQIGKGSTFSVFFPITEQEEVIEFDTTTGVPTGTERILLIDDEESLLKMAKRILASLGYKVVSEGSSVKALETFKSDPDQFDLIITDQSMPDLSGSELIEQLLEIKTDIPIILCSGFSTKVSEGNAKEKGISKYISKPYTKKSLASAIREVLDMKV